MKRLLLISAFSFILIWLSGCESEGPQIDMESSIPVKVQEIQPRSIKEYVFATGTVKAVNSGELTALQQGAYRLQTNPQTGKKYAMGDNVSKRDVIIKLFNPEIEYSNAIKSKKLNYEISKREYEKQKKLYDKGGVTLRELTDAESQYINAKYSLDNAELQLVKLTVMAPCDGVIANLDFHTENELIPAGKALGRVLNYAKLYIDVTFPEKDMNRVKPGLPVIVTSYGDKGDSLMGEVGDVSPVLDADSRMFATRIYVTNNDSLSLRPGMFVKASIVVAERDSVVVIPKNTVIERHGTKVVYVVEGQIAVERKIDIGLKNRDEVEVTQGVNPSDQLIVEGFETLRHRSKVKVLK